MPLYVIVDKATGKRLRESTTLADLRVSDPAEVAKIDADDAKRKAEFVGTPTLEDVREINRLKEADRTKARGRVLDDDTEELITIDEVHEMPDNSVKTWDAATRALIDAPPVIVPLPHDPTTETVLTFRGVLTQDQIDMIRKMVAAVAPLAIEE